MSLNITKNMSVAYGVAATSREEKARVDTSRCSQRLAKASAPLSRSRLRRHAPPPAWPDTDTALLTGTALWNCAKLLSLQYPEKSAMGSARKPSDTMLPLELKKIGIESFRSYAESEAACKHRIHTTRC
jgi:hypothetical protein